MSRGRHTSQRYTRQNLTQNNNNNNNICTTSDNNRQRSRRIVPPKYQSKRALLTAPLRIQW